MSRTEKSYLLIEFNSHTFKLNYTKRKKNTALKINIFVRRNIYRCNQKYLSLQMLRHTHEKTIFGAANCSWSQGCEI